MNVISCSNYVLSKVTYVGSYDCHKSPEYHGATSLWSYHVQHDLLLLGVHDVHATQKDESIFM